MMFNKLKKKYLLRAFIHISCLENFCFVDVATRFDEEIKIKTKIYASFMNQILLFYRSLLKMKLMTRKSIMEICSENQLNLIEENIFSFETLGYFAIEVNDSKNNSFSGFSNSISVLITFSISFIFYILFSIFISY